MANPSSPPSNGIMINRGSFSGAAPIEKQSPRTASALEKVFYELTVSPRKSITPTRTRSGTQLVASLAPSEPLSPLQIFYQYLSTLFKGIAVVVQNERLCISFDPKLANNARSSVPCIQPRSQAFVQKFSVELEISLEALFLKDSRFGQFLEEIAPYLASLTLFKTSASQKYDPKSCEKWHFPKLERIDFSRSCVATTMFTSLECPKLQELILRRAKGISLADIVNLATKSPKFLDIDFKKCPGITLEMIKEVLSVDIANLLFFLRSAKKFYHKSLEDTCHKKLTELFGDVVIGMLSNGRLALTLSVSKLEVEKLQLLVSKETRVQICLVIDYEKREDAHTKKCVETLNALKVETKIHIRLSQCEDLTFNKLSNLPEINELKLPERATLGKQYFTHVAHSLPTLCRLNMNSCQQVDEASFLEFLQCMPQLVAISLQGCKWVNEKILMKLFEACPKLVSVDVQGCEQVSAILQSSCYQSDLKDNQVRVDWRKRMSDQSVNVIAAICTRATRIVFENCETMTSAEPTAIFSKMGAPGQSLRLESVTIRDFVVDATSLLLPVKSAVPKIRKLKLEGPVGFSSIIQLLAFQQLTTLSIRNDEIRLKEGKAALIIDGSLKMLPDAQSQLNKLIFEGFSEITEEGIGHLIANCKKLRSLRIKDCPKINREALFQLCNNAGIDLQYSISPYRISIREIKEEDRAEEKSVLQHISEVRRVIFEEGITTTDEQMKANREDIVTTAKTIEEKKSDYTKECRNLKEYMKVLIDQDRPSAEDLLKLADCANVIAAFRRLEDTLESLKDTYAEAERVRKNALEQEEIARREIEALPKKCAVMTLISDSMKSLRPFEKLIEKHVHSSNQAVLRIHDKLKRLGEREGCIELKFLLTIQELNTLSTLGITKKWVSSSLEF